MDYLTVREFAQRAGISVRTVYRLVERDELRHVKFGRAIRIPVTALDAARRE